MMVSLWGLVALQGSLVALKDLWCPLWCPYGVWWPYRGVWWPYRISGTHSDVLMGFGGPTGGLVALKDLWCPLRCPYGVLVALQDLWCPLWCPYGVWWPYRRFGGPKGSLVPIVVSLWGLVALQGFWGHPTVPRRSSGGHRSLFLSSPHLCAWDGRWSRNGGTQTAPAASRSAPRNRKTRRKKTTKMRRSDFLFFHPVFVPPASPQLCSP